MYFCQVENFAYGEINERSFSNPHPWATKEHGRCISRFPRFFVKNVTVGIAVHQQPLGGTTGTRLYIINKHP